MGYRIDIDQGGCITCGICMDVCPVEALDMSRPEAPGRRNGPGPRAPAAVDDGAPAPGGRVHRLRHLHPRVPARRHVARHAVPATCRSRPARVRSTARRGAGRRAGSRCRQVTREALKPVHDSPWGDLFTWRTRSRPQPWQVWTSMVDDAPPEPARALPGGVPRRHRRRPLRGPRSARAATTRRTPSPPRSTRSRRSAAGSAPRRARSACRRGVLDEPIAIRTLKRFAAEHGTLPPVAPPTVRRSERVAIVGGGPAGMSAAWYLARLGYPVTGARGDARARAA